jgi:hypothetical protein
MRIRLGTRTTDSANSTPTSVGGKIFLTLFCGVFAAVGTLFFVFMARAGATMIETFTWTPTPCTILSSELNDEADGVEAAAGWQVRYRYAIDGQTYESRTITRSLWSRDASSDRRLSQLYAAGTESTCFVDHDAPADAAVLRREHPATLLWILFPLPFMAIGYGGLYFAWRKPRLNPDGTAVVAPVTSAAVAASSAKRTWIAVGLFGLFGFIGVIGTWFLGVKPMLRAVDARSWPVVPCIILSSEVETHDSDDGYTYSVAIVYRYEVGGRAFTSDRYKFFGGSSSGRTGKEAIVDQYPRGSTAVCYVNPTDPTDAVIQRGFSWEMAFGLIPFVFALIGVGGVAGTLARRSRARAASAADVWGRAGLRPARSPASALAGQSGSETSETRPTLGEGPVVLETRGRRVGKCVALLIFSLFWNGIVSVFVFSLFSDGWSGFSWFVALFLVPFVGIGLLVLGMTAHAALAIFNPHPRLHVSSGALPPGGTLELRWEMLGSTQRLRRFRIQLEGREEATYRRGTDTHTDKNVFARIDLADVQDATSIASGTARAQLPAPTMHSFTSKNNKIVWTLHVRGEIPRWPDIDDEFPFTVLAHAAARISETNE